MTVATFLQTSIQSFISILMFPYVPLHEIPFRSMGGTSSCSHVCFHTGVMVIPCPVALPGPSIMLQAINCRRGTLLLFKYLDLQI